MPTPYLKIEFQPHICCFVQLLATYIFPYFSKYFYSWYYPMFSFGCLSTGTSKPKHNICNNCNFINRFNFSWKCVVNIVLVNCKCTLWKTLLIINIKQMIGNVLEREGKLFIHLMSLGGCKYLLKIELFWLVKVNLIVFAMLQFLV